jgi:hypothetical protein
MKSLTHLPIELIQHVARYLNFWDYKKLRESSIFMEQILEPKPRLYFSAFRESFELAKGWIHAYIWEVLGIH